jgi:flavin-binding protein dodecin
MTKQIDKIIEADESVKEASEESLNEAETMFKAILVFEVQYGHETMFDVLAKFL